MRERWNVLSTLSLVGIVLYLVKCLIDQQQKTMDSIQSSTQQITAAGAEQMRELTKTFATATSEVTGKVTSLAEDLILGRDSPNLNESLLMNSTEFGSLNEPEIDLSSLPETARWAAQEEELLPPTTTPWQSSTQPDALP